MNILVVGAGMQGAACAAVLARQDRVSRVLLGSRRIAAVHGVRDRINSSKLIAAEFDAQDPRAIVAAVRDSLKVVDVVVDLTPLSLGRSVMRAALALGAHYVNTAVSLEHLEQLVTRKPLELGDQFVTGGRTALLACGASPGAVNIVCRRFCDQLDTVERIEIRFGVQTPAQKALVKTWAPTFNPEGHYLDYCDPPCLFRSGRHENLEPFSEPETYDFGAGLGEIELVHHDHEEVYSLPLKIGKGIQYCCFKYPLDPAVATFYATGFTPDRAVEVQGVEHKALDVLMQLIPRSPSSDLLDPHVQRNFVPFVADIRAHILIKGTVGGQDKTFRVVTGMYFDQAAKALELFGTPNVAVAYAAATGALLLMEGKTQPGFVWPEELDVDRFTELTNSLGLTLTGTALQ